MRRQFQIGPTIFALQETPDGWCVAAEWWEIDRRGEKDSRAEMITEAMPRNEAAERMREIMAKNEHDEAHRTARAARKANQ